MEGQEGGQNAQEAGGAAAATASGMVPMAHGTNGLGCIRIPSAQCGLVGVKPTQNRNPGGPDDRGRAHGLVVDHVLTRSASRLRGHARLDRLSRRRRALRADPKARPYTEEIRHRTRQTAHRRLDGVAAQDAGPHPDVRAMPSTDTVEAAREQDHAVIELKALGVDWQRFYRAQSAVSGAMIAASIDDWTKIIGHGPSEADMEPLRLGEYRASKS